MRPNLPRPLHLAPWNDLASAAAMHCDPNRPSGPGARPPSGRSPVRAKRQGVLSVPVQTACHLGQHLSDPHALLGGKTQLAVPPDASCRHRSGRDGKLPSLPPLPGLVGDAVRSRPVGEFHVGARPSGPERPQHPQQCGTPQDIFTTVPTGEWVGGKPATARMRAGSCTCHNGLCLHCAAEPTARAGRSVVIPLPDGTTCTGHRHLVTDGLGLNAGQPLAGDVFPQVARSGPAPYAGQPARMRRWRMLVRSWVYSRCRPPSAAGIRAG